MPGTCQHGLPADDCLICRTLPVQSKPAGAGAQPLAGNARPLSGSARSPESGPRRGSLTLHATGVVFGIVVIGLIAWVVAGAVFALLHILELVVVAGVAAWAGYRIGFFRGRRTR